MVDQQVNQGSEPSGNPADAGALNAGEGSAPAGNPADGTVLGEGQNGSAPAPDGTTLEGTDAGFDWAGAGLKEPDNLELAKTKGWNDLDGVFKGYSELEKKIGEKELKEPEAEATQEEWDAYFAKRGRPEKAEDYKFDLPEGIDPDMPYDNALSDAARQMFHEAGLTAREANSVHGKFLSYMAEQDRLANDSINQMITDADAQCQKLWGAKESEEYNRNVEAATRVMDNTPGLRDELEQIGAITPQGQVVAPIIANLLAAHGNQVMTEDRIFTGGSSIQGNPFADGQENFTQQSQLIQGDPQRAAQLVRAAGKNPADYNLA